MDNYYCHKSIGTLVYDYGKGTKLFSPWWGIVLCDQGIVDFYTWLAKRNGLQLMKGSAYGAHISFLKGEKPSREEFWGYWAGDIEFWYSNKIRTDNDRHAWLDCWSFQLIELRALLGYPPKTKMSYHLTLGRLL